MEIKKKKSVSLITTEGLELKRSKRNINKSRYLPQATKCDGLWGGVAVLNQSNIYIQILFVLRPQIKDLARTGFKKIRKKRNDMKAWPNPKCHSVWFTDRLSEFRASPGGCSLEPDRGNEAHVVIQRVK